MSGGMVEERMRLAERISASLRLGVNSGILQISYYFVPKVKYKIGLWLMYEIQHNLEYSTIMALLEDFGFYED